MLNIKASLNYQETVRQLFAQYGLDGIYHFEVDDFQDQIYFFFSLDRQLNVSQGAASMIELLSEALSELEMQGVDIALIEQRPNLS